MTIEGQAVEEADTAEYRSRMLEGLHSIQVILW
jgi:hypothetical protein